MEPKYAAQDRMLCGIYVDSEEHSMKQVGVRQAYLCYIASEQYDHGNEIMYVQEDRYIQKIMMLVKK